MKETRPVRSAPHSAKAPRIFRISPTVIRIDGGANPYVIARMLQARKAKGTGVDRRERLRKAESNLRAAMSKGV